MKNRTYTTRKAAEKIGVSFRTFNHWMAQGKIRASGSIQTPAGQTQWIWTDADIAIGRKVKAGQRPGPRPKVP